MVLCTALSLIVWNSQYTCQYIISSVLGHTRYTTHDTSMSSVWYRTTATVIT